MNLGKQIYEREADCQDFGLEQDQSLDQYRRLNKNRSEQLT